MDNAEAAARSLNVSVAYESDEPSESINRRPDAPPPAPKRQRTRGSREDRLAGFAAAARQPTRLAAVETIQATFRGHRVRSEVARLRPSSASSSEEGELLEVLRLFDKDGNGWVSSKEWGHALGKNQGMMKKYFGGYIAYFVYLGYFLELPRF